jgi:hypothetical protein
VNRWCFIVLLFTLLLRKALFYYSIVKLLHIVRILFQTLSGLLKKVSCVRVVGCYFVCQAAKRLFTLNFNLLNLPRTSAYCLLLSAYCYFFTQSRQDAKVVPSGLRLKQALIFYLSAVAFPRINFKLWTLNYNNYISHQLLLSVFCHCHCILLSNRKVRKGWSLRDSCCINGCIFIWILWLFLRINHKLWTLNFKQLHLPRTFAYCLLPSATATNFSFLIAHC